MSPNTRSLVRRSALAVTALGLLAGETRCSAPDTLLASTQGSGGEGGFSFSSGSAMDVPCGAGQTQACYEGPTTTRNVGTCKDGLQSCVGAHGELPNGVFGACEGAVSPAAEACNELDDDCNGAIDEGCPCMQARRRAPVRHGAGAVEVADRVDGGPRSRSLNHRARLSINTFVPPPRTFRPARRRSGFFARPPCDRPPWTMRPIRAGSFHGNTWTPIPFIPAFEHSPLPYDRRGRHHPGRENAPSAAAVEDALMTALRDLIIVGFAHLGLDVTELSAWVAAGAATDSPPTKYSRILRQA